MPSQKLGQSGYEILQSRNIHKTNIMWFNEYYCLTWEEFDNIECLVEVEEWRVAVPEAQSSVSDTAGPTKYLQVLLGTLQVSLVIS